MTSKITFLLLSILTCSLVSAQEPKVSISAADITIEQAFAQIEQQTLYSIAFNRTRFDVSRHIPLSLKNADIGKALSEILKNTGFTHKIEGNHIVIVADTQPPKSFSIGGYVKDAETGETLIGCHVMDSASNKGVTTNAFGFFSLTQNAGHATLYIHYLGYRHQSVRLNIAKDTTLTVCLKPKSFGLGEVVVQGSKSVAETKLSTPQMSVMNLNSREIKSSPHCWAKRT